MHTRITALMIAVFAASTMFAQSTGTHAIGLRFGGGDGFGTEISYQQYVGGPNRLEFDLGFFDSEWIDGFKLTAMYEWVHPLEEGFYWYAGVGAGLGQRDFDNGHPVFDDDDDEGIFMDADALLGIEYNFPIPLQLSLDLRPEIGLINDDFDMGFGLGVRYVF
jgi:hypothetical protein